MAIYLYQVVKGGVVTHEWMSTDHAADYYEPSFGDRAWTEQVPVLDANCNSVLDANNLPIFTAVQHPATFTITSTDITGTKQDPRWIALRAQRDALLASTKWIQERHQDELALSLPTTLSAATYTSWLQYWQSLRTLPDTMLQAGADPAAPAWPPQPPTKG